MFDKNFPSFFDQLSANKLYKDEKIGTEARNVLRDKMIRINKTPVFIGQKSATEPAIIYTFTDDPEETLNLFKSIVTKNSNLLVNKMRTYYMPRIIKTKVISRIVRENNLPEINRLRKIKNDYKITQIISNTDLIQPNISTVIDMAWLNRALKNTLTDMNIRLNYKYRSAILELLKSELNVSNEYKNKIIYFKGPFVKDIGIKVNIVEGKVQRIYRPSLLFIEWFLKDTEGFTKWLIDGNWTIVFEGLQGQIMVLSGLPNFVNSPMFKPRLFMRNLHILDGAKEEDVVNDPEMELVGDEKEVVYDDEVYENPKELVQDDTIPEEDLLASVPINKKEKVEFNKNVANVSKAKNNIINDEEVKIGNIAIDDKNKKVVSTNSSELTNNQIKLKEELKTFLEKDKEKAKVKEDEDFSMPDIEEDVIENEQEIIEENQEISDDLVEIEISDSINSKRKQVKDYFKIISDKNLNENEKAVEIAEVHNYTELRNSVETPEVKNQRIKMALNHNKRIDEAINIIKKHTLREKPMTVNDPTSSFNKSSTFKLNETYKEKLRDIDLENILESPMNLSYPILLKSYKKTDVSDREFKGYKLDVEYETHNGQPLKFSVMVPETLDGGNLYIGGNPKLLNLQNASKPIIKQDQNVIITTAYNKSILSLTGIHLNMYLKMMTSTIKKFINIKPNTGIRVKTTSELGEFIYNNLVSTNLIHLCKHYTGILNKDMNLDFRGILDKSNKHTYIGIYYGKEVWHDPDTDTIIFENKSYDTLEFIANIIKAMDSKLWDKCITTSITQANISYPVARIMGKTLPVILVILVATPLKDLLERLKKENNLEYKIQDIDESNTNFKSNAKYGIIRLTNKMIILKYNNLLNELLLNFLTTYDLTSYEEFDIHSVLKEYVDNANTALYLENFADMFIDPITKRVCQSMNLPDDFVGMFIYAVSLFTSYKTTYKSDIRNYRLSTQEEIVMRVLYDVISKPLSEAVSRMKRASRPRIDIPSNAVIQKIQPFLSESNGLSAFRTILETNDISVRGHNGINEERAFNNKLRMFNVNNFGTETCGTSYNGNSGITKQLPFDSTVVNLTGEYEHHDSAKELGAASVNGFVDAFVPYSSSDHPVRRLMQYGQFKHIRPVLGADPMLVSSRADEAAVAMAHKHAYVSKGPGKIITLNDKFIKIKYDDGTIDAISLDNVQRNSDKGYYLKNDFTINPKFKLGDKINQGDIIAFNKESFKVKGNGEISAAAGALVWVLQCDGEEVWEDSCLPFENLSNKLASKIVKRVARLIDLNTEIRDWNIDIGSDTTPDTVLFKYKLLTDDDTINDMFMNAESLSLKEVTAHHSGKIVDIRVYYRNSKNVQMSPSVKKFLAAVTSLQTVRNKMDTVEDVSDQFSRSQLDKRPQLLTQGNESKINGDKIQDGQMLIEYNIEFINKLGTADKVVLDRALKGEPTRILGNELRPVGSETGRSCDLMYSTYSVVKRMCGGLTLHGTLLSILLHIACKNRHILNRPAEPGSLLDYKSSYEVINNKYKYRK